MKYYTEKNNKIFKFKKNRRRNMYLAIIIAILMLFNLFFYIFDKRMLPTIIDMAEIKMESEAVSIINEESVAVYSENFKYDDIIHIEKDEEGNISLMRADTVMQNYLASQVVLKCNDRFKKYESVGVKIPIGYLTNSSFFYNMGPSITVKMRQVGNINTSYESIFESAGINQTRHKIYLNVDMKIRVIVPLKSRDVEVSCQIPVSDTIIVGKIPDTAINMNP
ncbi:MAG: sporulation protein YunB [Clostridium sp.]|uniref:sporulation protein YunB n=1 Tax=Clostridium sp. TaxID=1506 RepID=UPI001D329618|nr:sporulation protein YunB [Clostridium sp.]MBS5125845.1 sporulation protein YunB [Clostridium sp.]